MLWSIEVSSGPQELESEGWASVRLLQSALDWNEEEGEAVLLKQDRQDVIFCLLQAF